MKNINGIIAKIIADVKKNDINTILGCNMKRCIIKNEAVHHKATNHGFGPTITKTPVSVQYPYIKQNPVDLLKVWFTGI